jgi:hypothetical protein
VFVFGDLQCSPRRFTLASGHPMQHWRIFEQITEMFILCPALLGLKGNLEMTFASRLSTAAHLGRLRTESKWTMVAANLWLIQCQAILVAAAASVLSVVMGIMVHHEFSLSDSIVVTASAVTTASLASFILGYAPPAWPALASISLPPIAAVGFEDRGLMSLIVVNAERCQVDPVSCKGVASLAPPVT